MVEATFAIIGYIKKEGNAEESYKYPSSNNTSIKRSEVDQHGEMKPLGF